ncbi:MAG: hypothetical protein DLM72_05690 [Candidatus Nitrosopolaris wilkensis]|nr:MAG: hypothetical protein DLM72_05690 [Candidatus Nitrosopolaris wilkensis]
MFNSYSDSASSLVSDRQLLQLLKSRNVARFNILRKEIKQIDLRGANLSEADLFGVNLEDTNL